MKLRTVTPLAALALAAGCGGGTSPTAVAPTPPETPVASSVAPSAAGATCTQQPATAPAPAGSTTNLDTKPVLHAGTGPAPCGLQVIDLVAGTGAAARAGQQLTVRYVGVTYTDGHEFDASWNRGGKAGTFPFALGAHQVIGGWDQGLVGMKVGGRRELVIPPSLGYGDQGSPPDIPPNATLVFVVDLVAAQ